MGFGMGFETGPGTGVMVGVLGCGHRCLGANRKDIAKGCRFGWYCDKNRPGMGVGLGFLAWTGKAMGFSAKRMTVGTGTCIALRKRRGNRAYKHRMWNESVIVI